MTQLIVLPSISLPALITAARERARFRFLEFFASNICNPHTRRAYVRAVAEFLDWCAAAGVVSIEDVQPLHLAAWIEGQTRQLSAPTVKQALAAIRHLFDWLVTGQVVPVNPAASVRGPSHVVKTGKTPVLDAEDARLLLNSIDTTTPAGLRDRALIALMVYSFARVGAALGMKVEYVYTQNRRLWVRLRDKGGDLGFDGGGQHFSGTFAQHFLQRIILFWLIQGNDITICHGGVFLMLVVDLGRSLPTGYTAFFSKSYTRNDHTSGIVEKNNKGVRFLIYLLGQNE